MRDGIELAQRGVPAVALITEMFWAQSASVAVGCGMPGLPRIRLPYPVANVPANRLADIAEDCAQRVNEWLQNRWHAEATDA